MKKTRIEMVIALAALLLLPNVTFAQGDEGDAMSFDEEEVEAPSEGAGGDESSVESEEGAADGADTPGDVSQTDILDALEADEDDEMVGVSADAKGKKGGDAKLAPKDADVDQRHPIWAVQQVYALRDGRFDFQPSFGISMNDPYMQHQSISLALSYYITEILAIGASFNWYRFLEGQTKLNYQVSRATHQTAPINEYLWGGQLNFTYVPMYGKFAFIKEWILHWDVWVIGGGGFIFTRPIPVIDPDYRTFDYNIKFCFNVGIGGRLYLTRFLAIYLELRDYIYPEEIENIDPNVLTSTLPCDQDPNSRLCKGNWTDDQHKLTNNVMLHAGVTLFIPLTFEYKLPK